MLGKVKASDKYTINWYYFYFLNFLSAQIFGPNPFLAVLHRLKAEWLQVFNVVLFPIRLALED